MPFDKHYPNRKDHRAPYYDSRAIDATCRNHGSCPACRNAREWAEAKRRPADEDEQITRALRLARIFSPRPHFPVDNYHAVDVGLRHE